MIGKVFEISWSGAWSEYPRNLSNDDDDFHHFDVEAGDKVFFYCVDTSGYEYLYAFYHIKTGKQGACLLSRIKDNFKELKEVE